MFKCPFCASEVSEKKLRELEFLCDTCRQLVGVVADGPAPRLVRAAPDSRKAWVTPFLRDE
jgi:hypothetical protein